jgi:hypothetical protein
MPELTPDIERELAALDDALAGRRVAPDLTELGQLALALRDERPRLDEGFGRTLDECVERGFSEGDPRTRASRSGRRWWETFLTVPAFGMAAAVLLVALIVVAGPGGGDEGGGGGGGMSAVQEASGGAAAGGSEGSAESARSSAQDSAGATAAAKPGAANDFAEPLPPGSVPPAPGPGSPGTDAREARKVERSASLTLAARPRDIDSVSARIQEVTRRQGGFVVSSTVSASPGGGEGYFHLRIPTRNLDAAMADLSRLANVRERAQSEQDITAQVVSARSRLRDARTERKSLLRQLGDAVTLTETESIRRRLDIVSREIEEARAGLRRVNNRATFSTVTVTLVADRSAGAAGGDTSDDWTPGDAAKDALRVLEVAAGVALIVLAVALPLALLAALAAIAARWTRRRRREQALDAV